MSMGDRIKERRRSLGYTQEELGEKLGVKKSAVAKWENGRVTNLKRSIIKQMAEILECAPSYLMGFDSPEEESRQALEELAQKAIITKELQDMDLDSLDLEIMRLYKSLPEDKKIAIFNFVKALSE